MLLVLPDRLSTFDHRRQITSFEHLLEDYQKNVGEDDLTHLDEIIELHDLEMDKEVSNIDLTREEFHKRSLENFNNRALHHHVFDFKLLEKIFDYFGIRPIDETFAEPLHQVILGRKS